ncbi:MAG TPA: FecR domain-containing protein [Chitinivibrionales bacterium]
MHTVMRICLAALLAVSAGWSESTPREAVIQNMIGSVKVRKGDAPTWKDARPKMQLKEKDAIRTFVESQVEIMTSEGTVLKLDENSTMEMASFKQLGNGSQVTKVSILNGTLLSNVKKLVSTGSKFEFETPTATASIRGTKVGFDVSAEKTAIKVYEGDVLVTPKGATTGISVKSNQMTTIVKGQKTPSVEVLTEREKKTVTPADSVRKDTTRTDTPPTGSAADSSAMKTAKKTSADSAAAASKAPLTLTVSSPSDGQVFSQPMIPVSGTTSPGSYVSVNGIRCQVNPNGSFTAKIPIPDEENTIVLDIEATLNGLSQRLSRSIAYKPAFTLIVSSPQNQQTVNATSIAVAGQVTPSKAELTVADTKIPVAGNGKFSGLVTIPDEEGQVTLAFEASYQGASKTETRTVTYKRLIDVNKPSMQPMQFPKISSVNTVCFTVFDKTPDDEITFYTTIDGASSTETGQPNSSFCMQLQEGVHTYLVYAEDKAHNRTQPISGTISFLKTRPVLQLRRPSRPLETVRIPPGRPGSVFKPLYTVEFSILNLPDNDMRVIKEASVRNESSGQTSVQKDLIDYTLDFDLELQRGENRITIKVTDINNNVMQYPSPIIIDVR